MYVIYEVIENNCVTLIVIFFPNKIQNVRLR